ncbi:MAG: class I SAM-dependent methyltransferase [Myxococcota bacterium]
MSSLAFLSQFLRNPTRIGSVTPSSRALAQAMCRWGGVAPGQRVVELGSGTGPFTRELLQTVPDDLVAFEPDPVLASLLRNQFPTLDVREAFADRRLPEYVGTDIDTVVSGLPFTMWTREVIEDILAGVAMALKPGGRFVTFSYVHRKNHPATRQLREVLEQQVGPVEIAEPVYWNMPPAYGLIARRRS